MLSFEKAGPVSTLDFRLQMSEVIGSIMPYFENYFWYIHTRKIGVKS